MDELIKSLMDFTQTIEEHLGIKAKNEFLPMQPGDVKEGYADIGELRVNHQQRSIKGLSRLLNGMWRLIIRID